MANLAQVDMSDAEELGQGFRVVPPGEYQVYMESSEFKATKSGTGQYLDCVLVVADGEYTGAKIPLRFNLINSNPDAVRIAKAQLRAVCEATVGQPMALNNESSSLHNRIFFALIDNVPAYDKETGKDHETRRANEVVFRKGTIRSPNSPAQQTQPAPVPTQTQVAAVQQAVASQATPVAPPPPVTPGKGTPPWKK